ncbi:MAG: aminotransferase class I/II-fold pyridoxal phosphate-dependent enzyme [Trichodesmium sp. St16_bin4-tuft]|nr:aminotransferase class I/II-fold pyridoxal phosphate-dependent enzyme [Trichodesmium sp. St5_bin8]MDE5099250.1 aminotransferase class I/II-fold pyridoxal phosphate-dependent enzyme [Trichodesmium sp. St16_bin4-tuft]MDE5104796.1 aminotransferase class I/II-fold pyridoxal phosphate-dependent enzyme [Trichodesmium sp. St19_bin2]
MNKQKQSKSHFIAPKLLKTIEHETPMSKFYRTATYMSRINEAGNINLILGDSHEMPLPGFVEALQKNAIASKIGYYGYKMNLPETRKIVSQALKKHRGISILPDDIFMTNGTVIGLAICLKLLVQEGDEVIINLPPWLGYRGMINAVGAKSVGIPVMAKTFDLDLEKIANSITERTRAILINSPHNPTGKILSEKTLENLGNLLTEASKNYGKPIYLISDETFSRVVFNHQNCPSPTQFYPLSFLVYSYSKTWIAPGQRIGYIALPETMPEREQIRNLIGRLQTLYFGWCFPSALMQYALEDLENLKLNIKHLQDKRDWIIQELQKIGYEVNVPQGTFFLLVKSPHEDDCAFAELLTNYGVFVLPGTPQEIPGYFRISLTANKDMLTQALPKFKLAREQAIMT